MSHDLICTWLGLPAGEWPPDHYRLLGLEPGDHDPALIERRVHERLDAVRHYQMMYPEQATEAMNRLAQAFVCLTEPASKRQYDAALQGAAPAVAAPPAPPALDEASLERDPLAWLFSPPPVRRPSATPPPLPPLQPLPPATPATPAAPPPPPQAAAPPPPAAPAPPAAPPPERVDPAAEAAQRSAAARRGLGTRRGLYGRTVRTRQLLRVWDGLGKHLSAPATPLGRAARADLTRLLEELSGLLHRFPALMGEAGQPGYHVVLLTQQDRAAARVQAMEAGQRESLARDWEAGRRLLTAYRDLLRAEYRALRRRGWRERLLRAAYDVVTDLPVAVLLLLALLALGVALWRTYG